MGSRTIAGAAALLAGIAGIAAVAGAQEAPRESRDFPGLPETDEPPSILAILAHPDDEITIAPALAIAARSGGEVTLVFATSGDAGPGSSGLEPGEELAALREGEARCSARALGLDAPEFWRLGDGTLAAMARMEGSPARRLSERITAIVERTRPAVVMTWGPDGGYGHADHRMVSAAVTQVLARMDETRPNLLYAAIPADDARTAPPGFEQWATTHPTIITDRIAYGETDLDAAGRALACYESQFPAAAREALVPMLHRMVWRGQVHFRDAFPHEF